MTTDNKTMADVQPGGRVRLGDGLAIEKRARELLAAEYERAGETWAVWAIRNSPMEQLIFQIKGALLATIAALSAQPSPGGQDAPEIEQLRALVSSILSTVSLGHQKGPHAYAGEDFGRCLAEAARDCRTILRALSDIAARQPVGEPVARLVEAVEGECGGLVISTDTASSILAHVFPTGQVATAYMVDGRIEQGLFFDRTAAETMAAMNAGEVVPLSRSPAQAVDLGTGVNAIAAERERQMQAEGFTRDGDQQYRRGELAWAATAYVQLAAMDLRDGGRDHIAWHGPAAAWPWAPEWWKPVDARRDLVRAGALIAAQIDLIDSQAVGK